METLQILAFSRLQSALELKINKYPSNNYTFEVLQVSAHNLPVQRGRTCNVSSLVFSQKQTCYSSQELRNHNVLIYPDKYNSNTISCITLQEQKRKTSGLIARWSHQACAELKLLEGSRQARQEHSHHRQRLKNGPFPWICGHSAWPLPMLLFARMADKFRVICQNSLWQYLWDTLEFVCLAGRTEGCSRPCNLLQIKEILKAAIYMFQLLEILSLQFLCFSRCCPGGFACWSEVELGDSWGLDRSWHKKAQGKEKGSL